MSIVDRHRRSIRLKGYNYSREGVYFVNLCCRQRACLFGEIVAGEMHLNALGAAVAACWWVIPDHFPHAALDAFVVMPNHLHGIIVLTGNGVAAIDGGDGNGANVDEANVYSPLHKPLPLRSPSLTIGSIVRGFKIGVGKWLRAQGSDTQIWQRNYYEQIVRDDTGLQRVRQYIADNPARWDDDAEHPANLDCAL